MKLLEETDFNVKKQTTFIMMNEQPILEFRTHSIDILNDDCLLRVFDFLDLEDKICLRRVCRRWKYLLDYQLNKLKSIRIGFFGQSSRQNCATNRETTGTIFNNKLLLFPADLQTKCFSINQHDYLYRCLKFNAQNITSLSLGNLNISYRLLLMISHNLPKLEHLELVACASSVDDYDDYFRYKKSSPKQANTRQKGDKNVANQVPSLSTFNNPLYESAISSQATNTFIYNQSPDEEINLHERLMRSRYIKSCSLVKCCREQKYLQNIRHVTIKHCHQLSEFSLSLLMAMINGTLERLIIESSQRLTGEFMNYCNPENLSHLSIKYCPMIQQKFLDDLMRLRQILQQQYTNCCPASTPLLTRPGITGFFTSSDNNRHNSDIPILMNA